MLYQTYQTQDDVVAPLRWAARWARRRDHALRRADAPPRSAPRSSWCRATSSPTARRASASPRFRVGNREVPVTEEVALDLPFGRLLHFAKDIDAPQPRVLVAAPLSGHFATLLRGTVEALLRDHDVYVTDWANARDVPLEAGRFGVDDYVAYLIRFLEAIGPGGHILAVCQPCVQTLAAVAVMSEERNPATPRSMTLMAGPIDVRESPTKVNELANSKPLSWFERTADRPRPGALPGPRPPRLSGLRAAHRLHGDEPAAPPRAASQALPPPRRRRGRGGGADQDLLRRVFRRARPDRGVLPRDDRPHLPAGRARHRAASPTAAARSTPARSATTALLTVEGGRDDICALGQTAVAHDLCTSLRPHLKRHHLQANVGHYGVFSGRRWEKEVYPVVRNMILAME